MSTTFRFPCNLNEFSCFQFSETQMENKRILPLHAIAVNASTHLKHRTQIVDEWQICNFILGFMQNLNEIRCAVMTTDKHHFDYVGECRRTIIWARIQSETNRRIKKPCTIIVVPFMSSSKCPWLALAMQMDFRKRSTRNSCSWELIFIVVGIANSAICIYTVRSWAWAFNSIKKNFIAAAAAAAANHKH